MRVFDVVLYIDDLGRATIALPFDPKAEFGRSRAPVQVTVDHHPSFGTTVDIHHGVGFVEVRKSQVTRMGLASDQQVQIQIELDRAACTVDLPPDLVALLILDADAMATYESLSVSHQQDYVQWIIEAKQEADRAERLSRTIELLRDGVTTPA